MKSTRGKPYLSPIPILGLHDDGDGGLWRHPVVGAQAGPHRRDDYWGAFFGHVGTITSLTESVNKVTPCSIAPRWKRL